MIFCRDIGKSRGESCGLIFLLKFFAKRLLEKMFRQSGIEKISVIDFSVKSGKK